MHVCLPRLDGWGEEPSIKPAYVNHSSSGSNDELDEVEVTIALLHLAIEVRDQLNAEAARALEPQIRDYTRKRKEYEAEALQIKELRRRQAEHIRHQLGYYHDMRITLDFRKQPLVGRAGVDRLEVENNSFVVGTKGYQLSHVTKIERRVGEGKFGQFVDTGYPLA